MGTILLGCCYKGRGFVHSHWLSVLKSQPKRKSADESSNKRGSIWLASLHENTLTTMSLDIIHNFSENDWCRIHPSVCALHMLLPSPKPQEWAQEGTYLLFLLSMFAPLTISWLQISQGMRHFCHVLVVPSKTCARVKATSAWWPWAPWRLH